MILPVYETPMDQIKILIQNCTLSSFWQIIFTKLLSNLQINFKFKFKSPHNSVAVSKWGGKKELKFNDILQTLLCLYIYATFVTCDKIDIFTDGFWAFITETFYNSFHHWSCGCKPCFILFSIIWATAHPSFLIITLIHVTITTDHVLHTSKPLLWLKLNL